MRTILRYSLALVIAVTGLCAPLMAQSPGDTCVVTGYAWGSDMRPAPSKSLTVVRITLSGSLYTLQSQKPYNSNSAGVFTLYLPRGCTAYLYSEFVPGLGRDKVNGTAVTIPNTPTARLESLVPATTVPTSYVVAVPPQRYRVLENGTLKADTVSDVDFVGATVTNPSAGKAVVTITGGGGGGTVDQTARDSASAANRTANTADGKAIAAQSTANAARDTASVANRQAWTATTQAGTAQSTASSAQSAASSAQTTANNARDTASVANKQAWTATTQAGAASSAASSAQTTANAARDTASVANKQAWTADGKIVAHAARTDNPHSVTAVQLGALTSESDPTATSKAQVVVRDTLNKVFKADSLTSTAINWNGDWTTMYYYVTLGANTTFTFANLPPAGYSKTIIVRVTNTASNYTVTWPSTVRWFGGTPTQSTGVKTDVYTFVHDPVFGVQYGAYQQDAKP